MTWFELYAFFGAPLVAVGFGLGLAWWARRQASR
jgi:hypothetical protein